MTSQKSQNFSERGINDSLVCFRGKVSGSKEDSFVKNLGGLVE